MAKSLTTNQMIKIFSDIRKDCSTEIQVSSAVRAQIKSICKDIKGAFNPLTSTDYP
jgi:hypothetical protein